MMMDNPIYRLEYYAKNERQYKKCMKGTGAMQKLYNTYSDGTIDFWCGYFTEGDEISQKINKKPPFYILYKTPFHPNNTNSNYDYQVITTFKSSTSFNKLSKVFNFLYENPTLSSDSEFSIKEFSEGANVVNIIDSPFPPGVKIPKLDLKKWLLWGGLAALGIGYLTSRNE